MRITANTFPNCLPQQITSTTQRQNQRGMITDSRSRADFFNHLISLQNNPDKAFDPPAEA